MKYLILTRYLLQYSHHHVHSSLLVDRYGTSQITVICQDTVTTESCTGVRNAKIDSLLQRLPGLSCCYPFISHLFPGWNWTSHHASLSSASYHSCTISRITIRPHPSFIYPYRSPSWVQLLQEPFTCPFSSQPPVSAQIAVDEGLCQEKLALFVYSAKVLPPCINYRQALRYVYWENCNAHIFDGRCTKIWLPYAFAEIWLLLKTVRELKRTKS